MQKPVINWNTFFQLFDHTKDSLLKSSMYNFFFRQHELCLQLRDTQNAEYLGEIYLDITLTPQSREEREQVANT